MRILAKLFALAIVLCGGLLVWVLVFPWKPGAQVPGPKEMVRAFGWVPIIDLTTLTLAFILARHFGLIAALLWFVLRFWAVYRLYEDGWFWFSHLLDRFYPKR